jgi:hypothetical protein
MKFTNLIHFGDKDFEVTTAATVETKHANYLGIDYLTSKGDVGQFRKSKSARDSVVQTQKWMFKLLYLVLFILWEVMCLCPELLPHGKMYTSCW